MASEQSSGATQHASPSSTAPGALSTSTTPSHSDTASSASGSPFSLLSRSTDDTSGTSSGSEAGSTVAAGARSSGGSDEGEFEYVNNTGSEAAWRDASKNREASEQGQSGAYCLRCHIAAQIESSRARRCSDVSSVTWASPPPSPVAVKASSTSTSRASPPVYSKWAPPGYVPSVAKPAVGGPSTPAPPFKSAATAQDARAKKATLAKMKALLSPKEGTAGPSTPSMQPAASSHIYPPSPAPPRTSPTLATTPLFERAVESTISSNARADNHEATRLRKQLEHELASTREKLKELEEKLEERGRLLQQVQDEAAAREKEQVEAVESGRRQVDLLQSTFAHLEAQVDQYKADLVAKQLEVDSLENKLDEAARELVYSEDDVDEQKKEAVEAQTRLKETLLLLDRARGRIIELETLVELRDMDLENAEERSARVAAELQSAEEKLESTTERCQKAEKLAVRRQKELDKLLREKAQLEPDLAAAQNSPKTEALLSPVERDESDRRIAELEARLETEVNDKQKLFEDFETLRLRHQQLNEEHEALKSISSKRIFELEAEKKAIERRATQFAAQAVKAKEELKKGTAESPEPRSTSDTRFVYTADQLLTFAESPAIPALAPGSLPLEIEANKPKALYDDPQAPVTTYIQVRGSFLPCCPLPRRSPFQCTDARSLRLAQESPGRPRSDDAKAQAREDFARRGERRFQAGS